MTYFKKAQSLAGIIFLLSLLTLSAFADNGDFKGNGGDHRCQDFANRMAKTVFELRKVENKLALMASELPGVNLGNLVSTVATNSCVPVYSLDRVARSFRKDNTTKLLVSVYETMSAVEKTRLAIHELMVLVEMENDGVYVYSNQIMKILQKESYDFKIFMLPAKTVIENHDGSVTLINPETYDGNRVMIIENDFENYKPPGYGLCRYYGFSEYRQVGIENMGLKRRGSFIQITGRGYPLAVYENTKGNVSLSDQRLVLVNSVTCSGVLKIPQEKASDD